MNLSDRAVSYLRTVVPVLWGSLIGLLVASATWLPQPVVEWLSGEAAVGVVTAGAIALWYALWRWAEPRIPDWLTRVVLGSALAPTYAPVVDGVTVTDVTDAEVADLLSLASALTPGDPSRAVLDRILRA